MQPISACSRHDAAALQRHSTHTAGEGVSGFGALCDPHQPLVCVVACVASLKIFDLRVHMFFLCSSCVCFCLVPTP